MYYKSVNRGLSFTKPGLYAIGLLLLIGMVAVATGINGLYVFLSAGMGGFVISGLISERAMKSAKLRAISAVSADAGAAFPVTLTITNDSSWFSIYEMETVVMLDRPRFKLVAVPLLAPLTARAPLLVPKRATLVASICNGLPRGLHAQVTAVQKTTFPFGILEKFKVVKVPARLVIAPAIDQAFLGEVRAQLTALLSALDDDREFFSHRAYQARDPRRDIDWRKSAAKPAQDWVIKQYRSRGQDSSVRVEAPWGVFTAAATAADYERRLSRLRTVVAGLSEVGKPFTLVFGVGAACVHGALAACEVLAAAPSFSDRNQGLKIVGEGSLAAADDAALTLNFDGESVRWPDRGGRAC